jgi:hypothetical protein
VAGWTVAHTAGGGHQVLYLDDDTGEETVVGEFGPEVSVEEIIEQVLQQSEVGDWIIGPEGFEVRLVGPGDDEPQAP